MEVSGADLLCSVASVRAERHEVLLAAVSATGQPAESSGSGRVDISLALDSPLRKEGPTHRGRRDGIIDGFGDVGIPPQGCVLARRYGHGIRAERRWCGVHRLG